MVVDVRVFAHLWINLMAGADEHIGHGLGHHPQRALFMRGIGRRPDEGHRHRLHASRLKTSMAARTSSSFSGWRTEPSASTRSRTGRRSRRGTSCGAGG